MEIFSQKLKNSNLHWPLNDFNKAYKKKGIVLFSEIKNRDKSFFIRFFIPSLKPESRKYIMALRFYNFGELATIDFVSLNNLCKYRHIACQHMKNIAWPINPSSGESVMLNGFQDSCQIPYFLAGGILIRGHNFYNVEDDEGVYGNSILGFNVSDISNFIFSNTLEERILRGSKILGLNFFTDILSLMSENGSQLDFYENLFDHYCLKGFKFNPQNIGAILAMKAKDRSRREEGDFLNIICEEASMGIGAHIIKSQNQKKSD